MLVLLLPIELVPVGIGEEGGDLAAGLSFLYLLV